VKALAIHSDTIGPLFGVTTVRVWALRHAVRQETLSAAAKATPRDVVLHEAS